MKFISLFKNNDKKSDKAPDYKVSGKVGDDFVEVGGGWVKESKNGKYISIKFNDYSEWEYGGVKKSRKGWKLVEDSEPKEEEVNKKFEEISKDEINEEDIPFN